MLNLTNLTPGKHGEERHFVNKADMSSRQMQNVRLHGVGCLFLVFFFLVLVVPFVCAIRVLLVLLVGDGSTACVHGIDKHTRNGRSLLRIARTVVGAVDLKR